MRACAVRSTRCLARICACKAPVLQAVRSTGAMLARIDLLNFRALWSATPNGPFSAVSSPIDEAHLKALAQTYSPEYSTELFKLNLEYQSVQQLRFEIIRHLRTTSSVSKFELVPSSRATNTKSSRGKPMTALTSAIASSSELPKLSKYQLLTARPRLYQNEYV